VLSLSACAAPPAPDAQVSAVSADDCSGQGLVSLGMEDGMNGFGLELRSARLAACRALDVEPDVDAYTAAFSEGAARYCGMENANRLGRNGMAILRFCGDDQQAAFDISYQQGLDMRNAIAPIPYIGLGADAGPSGQRWRIGPDILL